MDHLKRTPQQQELVVLSHTTPMGTSPSHLDPPYHLHQDNESIESTPINTSKTTPKPKQKLKLLPLVFLIFFEVSGGPFGEEPTVGAAGPLLAILGFLIFPFIWSIPEALITAELATTFPGNGGYVIWAHKAFGPFWGSLMGSWKFLSGAINLGAYPVLCVDYLKRILPAVQSGLPRTLAIIVFNIILTFLNYTGLTIVGYTAVALGAIALTPFLVMAGFSIPKLKPHRWIDTGQPNKNWRLYLNTLFWNLNFWDNASTLAGEVDRPQKTFPKALLAAGVVTIAGYLTPLLAGTGALDVSQDEWTAGFLADAAGMIAGKWLKYWVEMGSLLSVIGLFEAQLSSSSFQLLGMADLGFLPSFLGWRSGWFDTPWVGILISGLVTLGVSFMRFSNIIEAANFLYALGMLLELASFVWLRKKYPHLKRPYRVPLGKFGVLCMCLVPGSFLVFVMAVAGKMVFLVSGGLTVFGVVLYFVMRELRKRRWVDFVKEELVVEEEEEAEAVVRRTTVM